MTKKKIWALLALLGLVCLPALAQEPSLTAKAQPLELLPGVPASAVPDSLGVQFQNAGTPVVTRFGGLLKINCSTNLTCSFGSGVLTMTASATGATAWSGITAATNSNAGSFIASGNVWDFGAATTFKLPVAAGFTTTTNGIVGYDSTANNWIMGANGVKNINAVIPASISPANNDCVKWTLAGSTLTLNTAGAGCGSPAFSALTGGTNTTAAMLVGTGASLAPTGTGTISANQINGTALSGLATGILKNTTATGVPSIAIAADFPTLNQNTTGTAANLTGCTPSTAGSLCYWNGSAWTLLAGNTTTTNFLQETSAGVPSWAAPSGSGTVTTSGSPTSGQAAEFTAATVITGVATAGGGNSYTKSTIASLTQGQVLCADATPKLINCTSGVPGRTNSTTSDMIASTDRLDTVTENNAGAIAVTFTSPATLGSNFAVGELNIGAGAATNTLGAGTFQTTGTATKVLNQGEWCIFNSPDNVGITDRCASGLITAGSNISLTRSATGAAVALSGTIPFANGGLGTNSNFTAHQFFGNNTGSTAAPVAGLIGAADVSPNIYAVGGGTAQAQTVTLAPAVPALVDGLEVCWLPAAANTGAGPTLAPNGLTATTITKNGTAALIANDLTTTAVACAILKGTNFQLQNPQTASGGSLRLDQVLSPTANTTWTMASNLLELDYTTALANAIKITNNTAATVTTPQSSPTLKIACGQEWTGAGTSTEGCLTLQYVPGTGLNAQGLATIGIGTSSSSTNSGFSFNGNLYVGTSNKLSIGAQGSANSALGSGGVSCGSGTRCLAFFNAANVDAGAIDGSFSRVSSGVLGVGTGSAGSIAGTLGLTGLESSESTAPTTVAATNMLYADSTKHEYMAATAGSSTFGMINRSEPGAINQTAQTAAITTATLCAASAGACNVAGQYKVHFNFWGSGTACSSVTAGSVTFLLTWTDENAVAHAAVAEQMLAQTGAATSAMQATFPFQTALANESASGDVVISTNGSVIQYATGYTACTTGTGTYNLRAAVTRLQ